MKDKAPIILVDGHSYLYRAFHALPPLSTSDGRPTGAIRGVSSMLRTLRKDYPKSEIVLIMDAAGGSFRDEIYTQYKAHRPPMPEEMQEQLEPFHELATAMGFPPVIIKGFEADDVIGTLAVQTVAAQRDMIISTLDKDLTQLVNERVRLLNTMSNKMLDTAGVEEKFGVPPSLMVDYLALVGDTSDNIPGVTGIGPKTAQALLRGIGDLDAIYADTLQAAQLSVRGAAKLPEKLEQGRESAMLSRRLATIHTAVGLDFDLRSLPSFEENTEKLLQIYEDLEFRGWQRELHEKLQKQNTASTNTATAKTDNTPAESVQTDTRWELVVTEEQLAAWVQKLEQAQIFSIDLETTSLEAMQARAVGVSVAVSPGEAAYIPFGHNREIEAEQLREEQVLGALRAMLEDPDKAKIGQNLKYDWNVFANHGIELRGIARDTMLESYVLDSVYGQHHSLDELARRHLKRNTITFNEVAGKGVKQLRFDQIPFKCAAPYAAEDADVALQLDQKLYPRLQDIPELHTLFSDMEMPLLRVLARMERDGTLIDPDKLRKYSIEITQKIATLEKQAWETAGAEFNLGSTKQLREILYQQIGLQPSRKTPKGEASTNEAALKDLKHEHPLPGLILEYRHLDKLKSTYTDRLPEQIDPDTGRVHTSWHQAVTSTGRLSSSNPNLQNIPIRTEEGRHIRRAFIAAPGYKLLTADYSQIELRIMAHLSGDTNLCTAFEQGADIHRATASEIFRLPIEQVSTEQRRSAKAINFGLIYGMSAFGLARRLGIDHKDARDYIGLYFDRYPAVREYMKNAPLEARHQGFVSTLFGRRLYLPEIRSANQMRRRGAERVAINAPLQGSSADIIKRAMVRLDEWMHKSQVPARMIIQVHDELVVEVREDMLEEMRSEVVRIMSEAAELKVPLIIDSGTGDNWDEAH